MKKNKKPRLIDYIIAIPLLMLMIFVMLGLVLIVGDTLLRKLYPNPADVFLDLILPWRWFT
jgi:hypothetical protein